MQVKNFKFASLGLCANAPGIRMATLVFLSTSLRLHWRRKGLNLESRISL